MSTITLPNIRVSSDLTAKVRLKDGGVAIDWSDLSNIKACIYSDAQRALAGRCAFSIDEEDNTLLVCRYAATKMQYLGVNRIVVSAKYMGMTKTYDKPAFTFVRWTEDQAGEEITIEDPEVTVEIDVEDVSSSILQEAVDAAFSAADRANEAAEAVEHMVDIHTGPEGKSAYEVAVEEGYTGTEEEWLASLKGPVGETPDITIGTVTTAEPGTPAAATMTGTPEDPVLNLTIPKGAVGATPNFTVGTVTTGDPGTPVVVTITGTPEAPVLNVTIPQGMQGNTGSSVAYPYELVNNRTTDDATKGLSAAEGKRLGDDLSQLEAEVVKKDNDSEVKIKDGTDRIYIADSDDNAILKIDKDGLHTTDIDVDRLNHQDNGQYNEFFYLLDPVGNVILKVDKDGLHTVSVDAKDVMKNSWGGKAMATYGDSITAVNNGDFSFPYTPNEYNWGNEVAKFFSFAKNYGRGIGSTCFKYRDHGGQVAWVDTVTGNYVNRNDSYNYDNYQGHVTIPDGCTAIRGDGSSWLRLTSMFPASIRGTIDVVLVMFHNDFHYDMDTDVEWIPNDATDPEWAASDEYSALGGDYNIASVKGGIASVVMKIQALMPQATIVLMTPIGGVYSSAGVNTGDFNNEETAKMKKLADVVMDVAQRMSTPCINVYGTCGINTLNRTTYISDTIHPYTVAGRKKIGRAVSSGLIQQICL